MTTVMEDLVKGQLKLGERKPQHLFRQNAYEGKHPLPFAPEGVSKEYEALREMAPLPLIRLAVRTTCQRLRAGGVRTGRDEAFDADLWRIWDRNNLGSRQRIAYTNGIVHDQGLMSVWTNSKDKSTPIIRPESPDAVYIEPDPADPFSSLWATKTWADKAATVSVVYYPDRWVKFRSEGSGKAPVHIASGKNPLGRVPFVSFVPEIDAVAAGVSIVDSLVGPQKAIDTMRFNLLLAAQFAAYRQRIFTGYDPVVRDVDGNPVPMLDAEGNPVLDDNGNAVPMVSSPGRVGVDRALVFPGELTKVFDLDESDLKNYVTALDMLVATFAAVAQVPPQYLIGDFKNVSGDLMVATEATLRSFVLDLQTSYGESIKEVMRLASIARGDKPDTLVDIEVDWKDADPKNINQIASAASQMVPNGAPLSMFLEQMPGATPRTVQRWLKESLEQLNRALAGDSAAGDSGPKPEVNVEGLRGNVDNN